MLHEKRILHFVVQLFEREIVMKHFLAFRVENNNGCVASSLQEVPYQPPASGEVVIAVAYSSINYKDALAAHGRHGVVKHFPLTIGIDVAGHIYASADKRFKEGDAVIATGYTIGTGVDGGYAQYARLSADWVVPLPQGMSCFTAMALGTAGFTAALCVCRLEMNAQHPDLGSFVVTGATGGVGSIAIDFLSAKGYSVTALTGKAYATDYLQQIGASQILSRDSIEFDDALLGKSIWGGGIDNVGGDILGWLLKTVNLWGNVISVGLAEDSHLHTSVMPFILRGVSLLGVTASGTPTSVRDRIWQRMADDLTARHLDKIVNKTVVLSELSDVFKEIMQRKIVGRVVVKTTV